MRASDSPDGISADKREYKECGVNVKLILIGCLSPPPLPPPSRGRRSLKQNFPRWGGEGLGAEVSSSVPLPGGERTGEGDIMLSILSCDCHVAMLLAMTREKERDCHVAMLLAMTRG